MPVEVKGFVELRRALRQFQPEAAKATNRSLKEAMAEFTRKSKGFVPSHAPNGLSRWGAPPKYGPFERGKRPFPSFDAALMRKGIVSKTTPSKPNRSGFRSLARVENRSAAGAIYETAGRKTHGNNPRSRSRNPKASAWFFAHLPALSKADSPKWRGRLIFQAYDEDNGRTTAKVVAAVLDRTKIFNIMGGTKEKI